jgi:hypothetical protein
MALADIIILAISVLILLLIGSAVLNGLSKGIIKNKHSGSFGRAFGTMLIGCLAIFLIWEYVVPFIETYTLYFVGLFLGLVLIWFIFAGIITAFYHCSFGRAIGVSILLAIILVLILVLLEFLLVITLLPILLLAGL